MVFKCDTINHQFRSKYMYGAGGQEVMVANTNNVGTDTRDLINYYTKDQIDYILTNYVAGGDIDNPINMNNYYKKTEVYNKNEVDLLLEGYSPGEGGSGGSLSNYYDKEWIDSSYNNISTSLNDLISADQTINNSITSINNRIDTLELAIESGSGSGGGHNYMQIIVMTEADYSALETVDRTKIYMLY